MQSNFSPKTQVILLTGGLASGKSTVAKLLEDQGAVIIDTDQIAKSLLTNHGPCFRAVLDHFGEQVLLSHPDQSDQIDQSGQPKQSKTIEKNTEKKIGRDFQPNIQINRQKLREIIFKDPTEKLWLEKLLHPKIREIALEQANQLKNSEHPPAQIIIVIPLLASKNLYPADKILTIESPHDLQIKRVMARDHISKELATQMIQSQPSSKQRQDIADFVIFNHENMGFEKLKEDLKAVFPAKAGTQDPV